MHARAYTHAHATCVHTHKYAQTVENTTMPDQFIPFIYTFVRTFSKVLIKTPAAIPVFVSLMRK